MVERPDQLGPGEDTNPGYQQPEGVNTPIPVGDAPGKGMTPDRRSTLEMCAVVLDGDAPEVDHTNVRRRTSTERDGFVPVHAHARPPGGPTERQLDDSAHDLLRESAFDSVPDDAGPQSDKW